MRKSLQKSFTLHMMIFKTFMHCLFDKTNFSENKCNIISNIVSILQYFGRKNCMPRQQRTPVEFSWQKFLIFPSHQILTKYQRVCTKMKIGREVWSHAQSLLSPRMNFIYTLCCFFYMTKCSKTQQLSMWCKYMCFQDYL